MNIGDGRCILFVLRGGFRKQDGLDRMIRETYWEVIPINEGVQDRLGPLCGLDDCACVVVCGVPNIRTITMRRLAGATLVDTVSGITLCDRRNPSRALETAV